LDDAIGSGCLSAEYYPGDWQDVGTPERLAALDVRVRSVIS
jgi:MurNAc alpha-1-phosphate uridylyltransferase